MNCSTQIFDINYSCLEEIDWNFPSNRREAISKIHPYPAKFIESLPRTLINLLKCDKNTIVFDPFCGSGTTLLEAQRAGIPSIGIDLNPIACLISRVKVQPLESSFADCYQNITNKAKLLIHKGVEIPSIPNLNHWFSSEVQLAIAALNNEINKISNHSLKDALQFCLSSIIVRVSKQESDTRYAAINKTTTIEDVLFGFANASEKLLNAKSAADFPVEATVIEKNILKVKPEEIKKKIGLVITSPPYPNAYEYWLYHKYRMWWLGFDPIYVRSNEIGARPHYHKRNGQTEHDFSSQMNDVFKLIDHRMASNGKICLVIGRSIIKGRYIDNAEIINKIATMHNYKPLARIERQIQANRKSFNLSYGKINSEYILIYQKGVR